MCTCWSLGPGRSQVCACADSLQPGPWSFGIASGMKPERGLVAAFVEGSLISALSGSQAQIGGPAGVFFVIV